MVIRINFSELFPTDEDKHKLIELYHLFDNDKTNLYERFSVLIKNRFDIDIEQHDMERFRSWFKRVRQVLDKEYEAQPQQLDDKGVAELFDKVRLEKIKVREEKRQLAKYEREMARTELIMEYLDEAIEKLPRFEHTPPPLLHSAEREAVLLLSDLHWGQEVKPDDVWPILNEFSTDIFKQRMEYLASEVVKFCEKEHIGKLHILSLGDELENDILFANQVLNISESVVDQLMHYSEYKASWLHSLSKHMKIDYHIVPGNHTRLAPKRKDAIRDNNWTRISAWYIKNRLSGYENINACWNDSDFCIVDVLDYKILGLHGHQVGNLEQAIQEYMAMFNIQFDALALGHFHSPSIREVHGKDVMVNGSLVGSNEFSITIRKTSKPSQKLFIVERDVGRTLTWDIKLDKV